MQSKKLKGKGNRMCEICLSYPCHYRCPSYKSKAYHYCSICNEEIQEDEEYVESHIGEYAHIECLHCTRDTIEFLGYEMKRMEY